MDVHFEDFRANQHTVEMGADDTAEDMRRKVASAMGLPEDSFCMSFGDEAMGEGYDMTQLSAGDTIVLTATKKFEAVAALHALGQTDLTLERLEEVQDPEVACLLLQAEVATVIPYAFLSYGSFTRLDLSAVSTVTHVGHSFLLACESLTSLDLSSLNSLTHVGDEFLKDCDSLTSLDLSSLTSLTHVGDGFLNGCSSLTSLDLSSFNSLTHVEESFLHGCIGLTSLDLSSFNSLTDVGECFLQGCIGLTSLDLSSLSSVEHIGDNFCSGLSGTLQTIHLSGCSAVVLSAVKKANLNDLVVEAGPKRKRDESPDEDCKRPRLSQ